MKKECTNKFRILVADDDEVILDLYREVFDQEDTTSLRIPEMDSIGAELSDGENQEKRSGPVELSYDFTFCRQANDAVEAVRSAVAGRQPFSVVFIDVLMPPGKDGIWAAGQIRKMDPYVDIVFVTGCTGIDPADVSMKIPPAHRLLYLKKPFCNVEITQLVAALSVKWQMGNELRQSKAVLEDKLRERTRELAETNKKLVQDIEHRKQTENELRESRERLELALEASKSGVWEWDLKKEDLFLDDRALKILGYERDEIRPGTEGAAYLHHPEDYPVIQEKMRSHMRGEIPVFDSEYRVRTKNGAWRWLRSCGKVSKRDEGQNPEILSGTTVDVTERVHAKEDRKRLENSLRQAQKMEAIGTLAGGLAHDFNNVLSAINGYMGIMRHHCSQDVKLSHYIDRVMGASNRATDLIRNMMAFSRQAKAEKVPLDIGSIVGEVLKLLRPSIPSTIEISHSIKTGLDRVLADPSQIHQVVMNLCTNAYQAMENSGGRIEVILEPETISSDRADIHRNITLGRYLKLSVTDSGPGIDQDIIERIFEPYFTTKKAGEGTGLGLAMVHGIVEEHKGAILVDSEPGIGTGFHVYLPVTEKGEGEAGTEVDAAPEPVLPGNERILFVDDEKCLADLGKEMLEDYGYHVESVTNPDVALATFKENHEQFDMVITDYIMPEMTGDRLAGKILEIRPEIPIIMCTGFTGSLTPEVVKEAGIKKVIAKPLELERFVKTIRDILEEKQVI
ncbi:MAG: response regulator [Desulfobacteraceae bacterium]|nr:response regulator [Desulfobacteraceae bacterium]